MPGGAERRDTIFAVSDEPASKADIARLETRLETEISRLENRLDHRMQSMENRLLLEIGHAINVAVEQIGKQASVVDEKYKDLPPRVATLEAHAADSTIHVRPTPPPARRRRK
jgi:hypothetical protein